MHRGDGEPWVLLPSIFDNIYVLAPRICALKTVVLSSVLTQGCDCSPAGCCPDLITSTSALVSEFRSAEDAAIWAGARSPAPTSRSQPVCNDNKAGKQSLICSTGSVLTTVVFQVLVEVLGVAPVEPENRPSIHGHGPLDDK